MEDPAVGRTVDGYRIVEVLGRGGMGVVYKAEDVALGREVAVKRIDPAFARDPSFLRRFRSEARALARIHSPHIVQVHALRETEIGHIIVMEYVAGGTVKDHIIAKPVPAATIVRCIQQTLTALEHAHQAGVIHRDIKPHNLLLSQSERAEDRTVKVTDFGLAKINQSGDRSRTVTRGVYGTLHYMSPEQVEGLGQVDARSDLYAVGMTMYEMVAGRLPFDEESSEYTIMRMIVEEELPGLDQFVPDVPPPLRDVVGRALEKDPADRYQSAAEMRDALTDVSASTRSRASAVPTGSPSSTHLPWMRRGLLGAGILTLLLLAYAGWTIGQPDRPDDSSMPPQTTASNQNLDLQSLDIPPVMDALIPITNARVLRDDLQALQDDRRLRADRDSLSFFEPSTCFVFVVDPGAQRVEAVLEPGDGSRRNLRTGDPVPDWRNRYAGRDLIWVAPIQR